MNTFKAAGFFLCTVLLLVSCSDIPDHSWSDGVPEEAPFVIIPDEEASLNTVLDASHTPLLDDITSSAVQLLSRIDSTAQSPISLNAISLYPDADNQLAIVWMAQASGSFIERMQNNFYLDFSQNQYSFNDVKIHILHLSDRRLFAAQLHDDLFISESSLAVEESIRAYLGSHPRANLSDITPQPGHIIMNTPSLDKWAEQISMVTYRPMIKNALEGTEPVLLSVGQEGEGQGSMIELEGTVPLNEKVPSHLVAAVSSTNAPIVLDQYISSNAAAAGLFRLEPRRVPPTSLPDTTRLDSVLMDDQIAYSDIAKTLDPEFSLVMYAQSGFLSTGEHLFLRKVSDVSALRTALNSLVRDDQIQRSDGLYVIQSNAIAQLIGGSFCTFQNFYLDIIGDVVAISKRKGLVEGVSSDRSRRRTMYYEQTFRNIKEDLPEEISGFFVGNSDFYSFVKPFLSPNNNLNALTSKFDLLTASTTVNNEDNFSFSLKAYQTEDHSAPYQEKWLFPTGADLTGKPILADIGGSDKNEVIFATQSGNLYALAADGTVVMQANTGSDTPVGSPVVYDWYGTNQNVILLAAGNKVYGWNDSGELLPKFPFELDEQITSPLVVEDIDRDGLPNTLTATADRKLHLMDGRGENINGWPITTNAEIETTPTVTDYQGATTIFAFAENALHGWHPNGDERTGFPKFINASLNGSPVLYEGNILGNAADGYLYSIGPNQLFADSLNVFETSTESSDIEAVYASNSALVGTPSVLDLTVQDGDQTHRGSMILTMSSNGSVFLINQEGQLRFTQSMGQPAAPKFSPFVSDIDKNGQDDVIALANFGRLYAWEIRNGERIYSVPTSGMQYPIVTDIDGDGYNELIAQTREGLRTWTIFGTDDENEGDSEES
ncbi:hypothetical protein CK503_13720 [Aliifodinibius salipaludis]|uniref:VCBS repeat-containing protein n=1 Tax=Fodinibius salipaludis TaxID=2032627 RepID=A0A2A2G764_9BACT|nr:hypothetical protein [Aliifodinibius salipaludis]PAU92980.1 hypothetical protein CK503_13720 [Aliifodinibius salipaludis]